MGLKCGNLEIKKLYLNLISFYFVLNNRGKYRKLTSKDGDGGVAFPIGEQVGWEWVLRVRSVLIYLGFFFGTYYVLRVTTEGEVGYRLVIEGITGG